jgi:transposase-like protein
MEGTGEQRKVRRYFTPEQKFEILKDIEKCRTIKEGLERHGICYTVYSKWQKQLMVGVRASLRSCRPIKPADLRRLEVENRKLKEIVLNQSLTITSLKKEMNLD